jgi:uncharacterized protein YndB with AHSA1/START domain
MTTTMPATRTITLTREYDAPCETVFAMWTQAEHIARWWGPDDCTAPHVESDPRPGGRLVITMTGPGFTNTMQSTYREIEAPQHFTVDSVVAGPDGNTILEASHTVRFENLAEKTRVHIEATATVFESEWLPSLDGMKAGWNQSLQCLDDALDDALDRRIVNTRVYAAPPQVVFPMWLEQRHLEKWWGPDGFSITVDGFDPRPRGQWLFTMHGPDGTDYHDVITYDEIVQDERIVYTHGDRDDAQPPFTSIVTFDEMAGMTALSMRAIFASTEIRDANVQKYGAVEGGTQTLARLAELLDS